MTPMTAWLATLGTADLASLLAHRSETLARPQPRSLDELAARLERSGPMAAALRALPLPALQLAEAIGALGGEPARRELAEFAGADAATTDRWLAVLTAHGLVWPGPEGTLRYPDALPGLFGTPLGLGPPLRTLVGARTVDQLRRVLMELRVSKPPTRRAEVVDAVVALLSDPAAVRRAVELAPPEIAAEVRAWALANTAGTAGTDGADSADSADSADDEPARYDPESYRARKNAAQWAIARGIAFGSNWSMDWTMPAEVARALRGPDYHAPFDPAEPDVSVSAMAAGDAAQHAARAVTQFADLVLAVVDRLSLTPIPALKSGGVGVREIDRLAKHLGASEAELRLALELCAAAGILGPAGRGWGAGTHASTWREGAPADRMATLLATWWELPFTPGDAVDGEGKRVPALVPRPCRGCVLARRTVLGTLANLGVGIVADPAGLCRRSGWRRPFAHTLAQDLDRGDGVVFATPLAEAATLGLVAAGALTPLGAAVISGDRRALHEALAAALPASSESALFGADLTAVVPGAPAAAVSRLLDSAADREGRGGATVWRFSPGSVRRALDAGADPSGLASDLAAIATGELPQPLRYLIDDIGRRHGNLRVSPATTVIRGVDEPLLLTVAADRSLRRLGLRRLAPTVLVSDADPDTVLAALRTAGYLPMPDRAGTDSPPGKGAGDAAPETVAPTVSGARPDAASDAGLRAELLRAFHGDRPPPAPEEVLDAEPLAARLLAAGPAEVPAAGRTEQLLQRARILTPDEARILASAVDTSSPVGIDYLSQSGSLTHRVISNPQLLGDSILAWCQLRGAERWFRIDRIRSVFQPDAG